MTPDTMKNLTFGDAIERLKRGQRVARAGWNGKGMWVRQVDLYNDREFSVREARVSHGTWRPFLVIKSTDNELMPWLASQADVLAEDWFELEER